MSHFSRLTDHEALIRSDGALQEDVLAELLKKSAGSGLLGLGGGSKFGGLDVKRVYFGSVVACTASLGINGLILISGHRNWLRDYSQAVDIAGLKQVQLQTILNIVTVLGFLVSARPD